MTLTHLSYSSLSTYKQCGEKYRLQKIMRAPEVPAWALVAGNAAHEATEIWDRQQYGQQLDVSADFNDVFDRLIEKRVAETGVPTSEWSASGRSSKEWPDRENEAWWRKKGPEFAQTWIAWRQTVPWDIWVMDDDTPAIELEVNALFDGDMVKMFIDRVMVTRDGELIIVDLKFGSRDPDSDQLGTYAGGMRNTLGISPQYGTYWMGRKGGTTALHDLDKYTDERLGYEYATGRRGIEAGVFMPVKSNLCGSCSVRQSCFAYGGENSAEFSPINVES